VTAAEILSSVRGKRALVIGDICLDRWCIYDPSLAEQSRETGIPRIAVIETSVTPGAAGTVANNLVALGAEVEVVGVIGEDGFGFELVGALERGAIGSKNAVRSSMMPTFTYTKLINRATREEDRPRVDFVFTRPVPSEVERAVLVGVGEAWRRNEVVLVSDQAETHLGGIVTPRVRELIGELAAGDPGRVVWVDSRMRAELFRNVVLKCNQDEAAAASSRCAGSDLRRHTAAPLVVVTKGKEGALLIHAGGEDLIPTTPVANPVDICGAGDSFSAGAALALAAGASPADAVSFGNLIASITIMKKGTGTASPDEVLRAASRHSS
jgi:rfaE bifunctional protein kinase chain/domain